MFSRSLLTTLAACVSTATAQTYSCSYPEPVLLDGWGDGNFYMASPWPSRGDVAAVIFTIFGFVFAILATLAEGDLPHFQKETHQKAGLAIFMLIIVQALAGFFRPSPNPPRGDCSNDQKDAVSRHSDSTSEDGKVREKSVHEENQENSSEGDSKHRSRWIRQYCEYVHRFLGVTLLVLGWYNCQSGIVLQSEKFEQDDEQTLTTIFWSIAGVIAGAIVLIGYVIRLE